jgi:hypothetical protein
VEKVCGLFLLLGLSAVGHEPICLPELRHSFQNRDLRHLAMLFGDFLYQLGDIRYPVFRNGLRHPAFDPGRIDLHWPGPATLVRPL